MVEQPVGTETVRVSNRHCDCPVCELVAGEGPQVNSFASHAYFLCFVLVEPRQQREDAHHLIMKRGVSGQSCNSVRRIGVITTGDGQQTGKKHRRGHCPREGDSQSAMQYPAGSTSIVSHDRFSLFAVMRGQPVLSGLFCNEELRTYFFVFLMS